MTRDDPATRMRLLAAALLLLVAATSVWAAFNHRDLPQNERAAAYARDISVTASATYITLRTLNAFLSTAQELEVGVSLIGSGSAQPLKVLEPIDDTIERIASVIFGVMVVSGVLAVTMGPLGAVGFALLALGAAMGAGVLATGRPLGGVPRHLAVYGGFLGLGIPLAFLLSALVADRLTAETWAEHSRVVAEITATVEEEGVAPVEAGGLRGMMDQVEQYQTLASNLSNRADDLIGSFISLLSVYIFKVLVLPVMLIGGLFVIARRLGAREFRAERRGRSPR
ncbi:hypothetical protein SAMN04488020_101558 [Palleronia marisminoris]|uniref:Uncharacterized protein n=1 Tax=Palleronia marisminoris TaxID=315423 RepID=A0A1Y5RHU9_9RHOB|nr:hypothetical protein [Palleronia marisminoris]SFG22379.1 hypothetical protein SAMN04488020_101558 [Palleronia marisminoris]SLN17729.1 hypothetical protein PAM7066_00559 [Palleronia marisminoris]